MELKFSYLDLKNYWKLLLIAFFAILIRLWHMSISLDAFDTLNFAHAVLNFDITLAHPHPPYYVVYIGIAKFFNIFLQDPRLALIVPNAIFGGLTLIPLYLIAREFLSERNSLIVAFLLAINPLHWLVSEMAFSGIVSTFFVTFFVYLLLKRNYLPAALFFALAVGTRQTNLIFGILPLYWIRPPKKFIQFMVLFAVFNLIWFAPFLYDAGVDTYFGRASAGWLDSTLGESVFAEDPSYSPPLHILLFGYSVSSSNSFNPIRVDSVSLMLENTMFEEITTSTVLQYVSLDLIGIIGLIGIVSFLYIFYNYKDQRKRFLLFWTIPFFIWLALFQDPYGARYLLPLIPALCLILGIGYSKLSQNNRKLAIAFLLLITLVWGVRGYALTDTIHTEETPPLQEINYLKDNFDTTQISVIGYGERKHFVWYAPEINYHYPGYKAENGIDDFELKGKIFINKRAALYMDTPVSNCMEFSRDPLVLFQHSALILCEAQGLT